MARRFPGRHVGQPVQMIIFRHERLCRIDSRSRFDRQAETVERFTECIGPWTACATSNVMEATGSDRLEGLITIIPALPGIHEIESIRTRQMRQKACFLPLLALLGWCLAGISPAVAQDDWAGEGGPVGNAPSRAIANPDVSVAFDESEFAATPAADGLSTSTIGGVPIAAPLSFSDDSDDATLGVGGPPAQNFVDPPGFEGAIAATIGIDYGASVQAASFGFALSCPQATDAGISVDLLNATGGIISSVTVDAIDTGQDFPENEFVTATPHSAVSITFFGTGCTRFFIDNLAYQYGAESVSVPALGLWGLLLMILAVGSVGLIAFRPGRG